MYSYFQILLTLIDNGVDINGWDIDEQSCIHYACARGIDISTLLKNGANVDRSDTNNDTPLHHACFGREDFGFVRNHVLTIQQLLEHGCDPNVVNLQKNTPLHLSSLNGLTESIDLLLDKGANPNSLNLIRVSPIGYAASRGHTDIVMKLLKINCKLSSSTLNEKQMKTINPLTLALESHNLKCAQALTFAGCDTLGLKEWNKASCIQCSEISTNKPHAHWLKNNLQNVTSLQHLTRNVIRKSCLNNSDMRQLPLPKVMKGYITMEHLYEECEM